MSISFTETFYMFLITSGIGFLLAVLKVCYKSKCKELNFCCIRIIRDVETEEKIDEIEMQKKCNSSRDEKENDKI